MTRELKFRAWAKIHKHIRPKKEGEEWKEVDVWEMLTVENKKEYHDGDDWLVDSFTAINSAIGRLQEEGVILMQYTGLKDKNEKEIYEDDICQQFFTKKRGIEIGQVNFNPTQGWNVGSWPIWLHNVEVIGNIYENPELINDGVD